MAKPMAIPCQAVQTEGVTTIGSSPSTLSIGTIMEVLTDHLIQKGKWLKI